MVKTFWDTVVQLEKFYIYKTFLYDILTKIFLYYKNF